MSARDTLTYHWHVNLLGRAALRVNRWQVERSAKARASRAGGILAPPLRIAARNKELVGLHYLKGRYANRSGKVAWVTSGAPVELFKALGFYVLYPENHGAICGTVRVAEDIMSEAEHAGYSRDICSYARTDIGSMLSGKTPVGTLPKPDLLVACTNICQTVLHWYRVLSHHFGVPLLLIDTPFIYSEVTDHSVSFVKRQLEEAVPVAEAIAGKPLNWERFLETIRLSQMASELWMEILQRCQHRPSPISVFDQFTQMAPVVEMRGDPETVDFYAAMLREIDDRIAHGVGVVAQEKKRLLWDNLPVWYRLRSLAELLGQYGVAIVASTYTNAWGELAMLFSSGEPFEGMARTYLYPILNRSTGAKLQTMRRMIADYQLDGVILHSDRSCKPYSVGQMDQRDRLIREDNIPALLIEADHNDPRAFSEEQVANRLQAFVEMLEASHA